MSWSFSIPVTPIDQFAEAAKAALESSRANILQYNPDGIDQAEAAVESAIALAESGLVGSGATKVRGFLSGHGNPNHQTAPGMAGESVNIQINQTT